MRAPLAELLKGVSEMGWINNYAWFGRKAQMHVTTFLLGILSNQYATDYAWWFVIAVMVVFGWARDTKPANQYWMAGIKRISND